MALVVLSTEGCRPCAPHCGRERKRKFRERAPEGQTKDKRISTNAHMYIYIYIYLFISIYLYVPVPGPRSPPPSVASPTPPHHLHLGDDAGNAGNAVQYRVSLAASVPDCPLSPREPTPQHLSQHPTLNQTTLQPLLNPNPNPKSTQTPNPPEPTANQP